MSFDSNTGSYLNPGWVNGMLPDLDDQNLNDISNALALVTADTGWVYPPRPAGITPINSSISWLGLRKAQNRVEAVGMFYAQSSVISSSFPGILLENVVPSDFIPAAQGGAAFPMIGTCRPSSGSNLRYPIEVSVNAAGGLLIYMMSNSGETIQPGSVITFRISYFVN